MSRRGCRGLFSGSSSGLVAGDETPGVLWPGGAFCEAAAFWPAGVLFLLATVSDCVGGVPLWANACDIVNSKVRTRGTGLFTQTAPGPGGKTPGSFFLRCCWSLRSLRLRDATCHPQSPSNL